MKKINIIRDNREFERIIKSIRPYRTEIFNIFLENGNFPHHKFGISVSKKVGNAVIRNKIKRQLKNIIDKNVYQNSFNCIIIVRKELLEKDFFDIEKTLNKAFQTLKIIKENNNE